MKIIFVILVILLLLFGFGCSDSNLAPVREDDKPEGGAEVGLFVLPENETEMPEEGSEEEG